MGEICSNQIAKYQTDKRLMELTDKLLPADYGYYGNVYNRGGKKGIPARVGISVLDYSKGKGADCVHAEADVEAHDIRYLRAVAEAVLLGTYAQKEDLSGELNKLLQYARSLNNAENKKAGNVPLSKLVELGKGIRDVHEKACASSSFSFTQEKIIAAREENGISPVKKLVISHATHDNAGEPKKFPWYVCVTNGTGVAVRNPNGSSYLKSGSFKTNAMAFINISNLDFFRLMDDTTSFLNIWETRIGGALIEEGRKMRKLQLDAIRKGGDAG